jgi:hypothetical protein
MIRGGGPKPNVWCHCQNQVWWLDSDAPGFSVASGDVNDSSNLTAEPVVLVRTLSARYSNGQLRVSARFYVSPLHIRPEQSSSHRQWSQANWPGVSVSGARHHR